MRSAISNQLPIEVDSVVAFDCEASGLFTDDGARVSIVSVAWGPPDDIHTLVMPFDQGVLDKADAKGMQPGLFDEAPNLGIDEWDELCDWLQRQRLIAHQVKYDASIMLAGHRKWGRGVDLSNRVVWDTMVVCPIVFPNQTVALKPTAERLWGESETEPQRRLQQWLNKHKDSRGNPRYDLAPWDLIGPYASKDAEQCLRLYYHQQALIEEGEVAEPYEVLDRKVDLALCLFRMETRGVGFDVEGCREAANQLRRERDALGRRLAQMWGLHTASQITPDAARKWFFDVQGADPVNYTDKGGKPSVDQESMIELAARNVQGAAEYQQLAQIDSALSKYYDNWPNLCGPDGRLRPSYHQTKQDGSFGSGKRGGRGTISGRLAVERVQLQAIPHDFRLPQSVPSIRTFFQPAPGKELWEVDLSQAEIRVATHLAKCEAMRQVLLSGDDVHGQTAIRVFGVSPDDPAWSKWRTLAKRASFATIYGAGPRTFCRTLKEQANINATETQAREWLDEYRATFPEFRRLYYSQENRVREVGYVKLVTGQRRWFADTERQFYAHKALNQLVQGNVAVAMEILKVEVEYEYPGILLNEIHDSLMVEVPEGEEGAAVVKLVVALMEEHLVELFGGWDTQHRVPWQVDCKRWQ